MQEGYGWGRSLLAKQNGGSYGKREPLQVTKNYIYGWKKYDLTYTCFQLLLILRKGGDQDKIIETMLAIK